MVPALSGQLNQPVSNCSTCTEARASSVEPLLSGELPEGAWQEVGSDIFTFNHATSLLADGEESAQKAEHP